MKSSLHLSCRLGHGILGFRKDSLFNDVILVDKATRIPCSRIILSYFCDWFKSYFIEHPLENGVEITLDLPINPGNAMIPFLDLLFGNKVSIQASNMPSLLKMAVFYRNNAMVSMIKACIKKTLRDETALFMYQQLFELELFHEAVELVPHIAWHFQEMIDEIRNPERPGKRHPFTLEFLCASVPPRGLLTIIRTEWILPSPPMTTVEKVAILDMYDRVRPIKNMEDREACSSVVDWSTPDALQCFVKYPCDWVAARYARNVLSRALDRRRRTLQLMRKDIRTAQPRVSRWYAFSWLSTQANLAYAPKGGAPDVNVMEFVTTLGGTTSFVNPIDFGFLEIVQSVNDMIPEFGGDSVFVPGKYWIGQAAAGIPLMIGAAVIGAEFDVRSVSVSTEARNGDVYESAVRKAKKPVISEAILRVSDDAVGLVTPGRHVTKEIPVNASVPFHVSGFAKPVSVVVIEFKTKRNLEIVRLASFDVCGNFIGSVGAGAQGIDAV